ncbi:AraC family transcriptional regulator [Zobellella sp. CGMCC 1.18722]|uniref:AraC family transcriptional regulator n=1 Tax=Zobellella iuensis TaxID=2803811 RepID=A0ABS1QX59_9GAMM|nr:AraC family transcriptional regulator [Zobellella iuensis]
MLQHIHQHLDEPLPLERLAQLSACSRWQLQRDFQAATGLSLARYIRRLRLSRAAEWLLSGRLRQLDIALGCGFDSEVSFSRAFRQEFGATPGQYRKAGIRRGLSAPLLRPDHRQLLQLRIDSRPACRMMGLSGACGGLFANQPDFAERIPQIWQRLLQHCPAAGHNPIGVIETDRLQPGRLRYWAGTPLTAPAPPAGLEQLEIPAAEYLVVPHRGPPRELAGILRWVLEQWLPGSGYHSRCASDLEIYGPGSSTRQAEMEYWIPIVASAPKC